MPADIELDYENRLVRSRAWGVLTANDLLGHVEQMRQMFDAGTLDAGWTQLADFREVNGVEVSTDSIKQFVRLNPWPAQARRALVAPQDLVFGLARMYELSSGQKGENVSIFRSLDEALAWLRKES